MATLAKYRGVFLLGLNREVLYVDISEHSQTHLYASLPPVPVKPAATREANQDEGIDEPAEDPAAVERAPADTPIVAPIVSNNILQIAVSPDNKILAIATAGEKALYIYSLCNGIQLLSRRELARTSNAIRFNNDNRFLFVADKTGDCYTYDCAADSSSAPSKWILAHFSIVLDIVPTPCSKYIITCDRDEKIRCTKFPQTTVIQSYGLGHTEYVSAIALVPTRPKDYLLSVSGDKTMRMWRYMDGKMINKFKLPAPVLHMAVRQMGDANHVAVTYLDHKLTYEVYMLKGVSTCYKIVPICGDTLDVKGVTSIIFDRLGELIITVITPLDTVRVLRMSFDNGEYVYEDVEALNETIKRVASSVAGKYNTDEVDLLFKKKFENIQDYHERKKQRIEDKNKKIGPNEYE